MAIDDGTYGIVYCGYTGLGIAVFTVSNGRVEGRDWDGVRHTGTVVETTNGNILVNISQEVPPGVRLVHGIAPQDVPYSLEIKQEMPPLFGDGRPVELHERRGTATVMVKRIPDEYLTRPKSLWRRLLNGP